MPLLSSPPQLHDVVKSLINRLLGNKTPRERGGSLAGSFSILTEREGGPGGWSVGWLVESANLLKSATAADNDSGR